MFPISNFRGRKGEKRKCRRQKAEGGRLTIHFIEPLSFRIPSFEVGKDWFNAEKVFLAVEGIFQGWNDWYSGF